MCLSAAPVASALSACCSHRSVVFTGGLMCSLGVVLGAFARNLTELYLTVGVLNGKCSKRPPSAGRARNVTHRICLSPLVAGFGYALTWTPTVTMLGLYFEKRRPVANAVASSGECILTFVLTPLFQLLIDSFSWRGALLILGGLQLNLCVCGMLLRPLKDTRDATRISEVKSEDGDLSVEFLPKEDLDQVKASCQAGHSEATGTCPEDPEVKNNLTKDSKSRTKRTELKNKIRIYVDYTLITNARFMVYSMFGVFAALGFFAPGLFLVPYARSKGIEEYQAAALMSISAAFDLFGRLFFGWVANMRLVQTVG